MKERTICSLLMARFASMVVCNAAEACDELADTLRKVGMRVLMAGNNMSPREVDVAMAEGALVARET